MTTVTDMLCISTAHMDLKTKGLLDSGSQFGIKDIFRYSAGYGFFTDAVLASIEAGVFVPADIVEAAELAKTHQCRFFMFDWSEELDKELTVYTEKTK